MQITRNKPNPTIVKACNLYAGQFFERSIDGSTMLCIMLRTYTGGSIEIYDLTNGCDWTICGDENVHLVKIDEITYSVL